MAPGVGLGEKPAGWGVASSGWSPLQAQPWVAHGPRQPSPRQNEDQWATGCARSPACGRKRLGASKKSKQTSRNRNTLDSQGGCLRPQGTVQDTDVSGHSHSLGPQVLPYTI